MLLVLDSLVCLVLLYYTIPRLSPSLVAFTPSFSILRSFFSSSFLHSYLERGGNQSIFLLGTISFVGVGAAVAKERGFEHPEFCR